jgi:hypothetical protein
MVSACLKYWYQKQHFLKKLACRFIFTSINICINVYKYGLWLFLFSVPQQDENNELVASETDAYAIADFINVSKLDISLYHVHCFSLA